MRLEHIGLAGMIMPVVVFCASCGAGGGTEPIVADSGPADGGQVEDSGIPAFSIKGRVIKAPNGIPLDPDGSPVFIGIYSRLDSSGFLPDSAPIDFNITGDDGSFTVRPPADCSAKLIAFTGNLNFVPKAGPPPGSMVGAYSLNPVCKSDLNATIYLDHYLPGANKPALLSKWKKTAALESIEALVSSPFIDFSAYREEGTIFVFSKRGNAEISRDETGVYSTKVITGVNPFANDAKTALGSYNDELAAGKNPDGTQYPGYTTGDPRLSFVEVTDTSYPDYQKRLWQVFEDERCGDVVTFPVPYGSGYTGNKGEHGSLDITQSRAVLVFSGAGVKKGLTIDAAAEAADIAPTIAKALRVTQTAGINSSGRFEPGKYLKWQDGSVLEQILDGGTAGHALVLILDGLNFTEIDRVLKQGTPDLPSIKSLVQNGVFFEYGQIANYPSITLPGHVAIGTGSYSGHHGVANNAFYERGEGTVYNIVTAGAAPGRFLRPWVETLFEAAHRTFGNWDERRQKGVFCASVNEPTTRGADYATLEMQIFDYSKEIFDEKLPSTPGYETYSGADNTAVQQCIYLYERKKLPIPKVTIVNLAINDFVGHGTGPHSDMIRQALADTDLRIGRILQALKNAGIYEDTVIALTSDHGQELQDKKRSLEFSIVNNMFFLPLLDVKGIKYLGAPPFLYLKSLEITVTPSKIQSVKPADIRIAVQDEDTRKFQSDAEIQIFNPDTSKVLATCITDASGVCEIKSLSPDGRISISARHKDYNTASTEIQVVE